MTNLIFSKKPTQTKPKINVRKIIALLLIIGIFFRFYNLDQKVYWYDETMTSLRISGYTSTDLVEEVYNGEVISVENLLQNYQYPNNNKSLNDSIKALAAHPEHSPLYYLMARFWLQIFGNSVFNIRLLSAFISLLIFPAIYWLCLELFNSQLISWVAVSLIAVSPFHVLYAQEAREYSLWTVSILVSCAALLWAIRRKKILPWIIYGITVSFGLYTHPFSAFVFVGHGIYVLAQEKWRFNKTFRNYIISSLFGILLFLPWLLVVINNFSNLVENTDHVNLVRKGFLPLFWGQNLSRVFIDVNQGFSPFSPLHYLSAFLTGYALYYLCKTAPKAGLFVITLIGVTGIALIAPDIILSGRRSSIGRYAFPCYLGIQIAVSYLITNKLKKTYHDIRYINTYKKWRYIAIALIVSGILSCAVSSQIPTWWNKSASKTRHNPEVARIINQSENPLVISDIRPGELLGLTHSLQNTVNLQLVSSGNIPQISQNYQEIFIYRPSDELRAKFEAQYNIEKIQSWLWELKKIIK
ncbi:MAG: glycosyltransferase family 39 protein [Cyanobacteriota bacterium]|nr:glycosyltransferase family 39 protein [Cyanobacteriota bacterium]